MRASKGDGVLHPQSTLFSKRRFIEMSGSGFDCVRYQMTITSARASDGTRIIRSCIPCDSSLHSSARIVVISPCARLWAASSTVANMVPSWAEIFYRACTILAGVVVLPAAADFLYKSELSR